MILEVNMRPSFTLCAPLLGVTICNLVSFNQLALEKSIVIDEKSDKEKNEDLIAEYFECLTECDDDAQTCGRVCGSLFWFSITTFVHKTIST